MTRRSTLTRRLTVGLCCLLALTAAGNSFAQPGKGNGNGGGNGGGGNGGGGGGATPTGEIYFNSSAGVMVMNADGSGKSPTEIGQPTIAVHDGFRWMAQILPIAGESYTDGSQRVDVFAVREDGQDAVQLTNDPTREVIENFIPGGSGVNWASDLGVVDGKVSFNIRRFEGNGDVIETAINVATVAWDNLGPIAGTESLAWSLPPFDDGDVTYPSTFSHSWSPDGEYLVHDSRDASAIFIVDPVAGLSVPLTTGFDPQWSPDGNSVALYERVNSAGGVYTIDVDGTNRSLVIEGQTRKSSQKIARYPRWSPDSQFLTYRWHVHNNGGDTFDVFVIGTDGSDNTNLTSDFSGGAGPVAWR